MYYSVLLIVLAFWLGACPFSVWIGRWFMGRDITTYGDGNPGAANVFRAGGQKLGVMALVLDIAKGVPFVFLAHSYFHLPELSIVLIGMSAIVGHAFSPFLRWNGGKAIAVTYGVLLALPQHEILIAMVGFMALGFLLIEIDAWTVIFGALASLVFLVITRGSSWETFLMLGILAVLVVKHFDDLHVLPGFQGRLLRWLQAIIRGSMFTI